MPRYALRRVLWAIPTLLAISLVLFFVTTLAPDPAHGAPSDDPLVEEGRRSRFLDLPRFVNSHPEDLHTRADWALAHAAASDGQHERAARELVRIGGAGLPYVLPRFEALSSEDRARVAVALVPLAERMELVAPGKLGTKEDAVLFWSHFWDDRALDFTTAAVDRAVERLVEHGSDLREKDLIALDTFALPSVVAAIAEAKDPVALGRLTRIAQHAARRGPVLPEHGSPDDARRVVADWQEWWFVHANDFVALDGVNRAVAFFTETRYGKWLRRATSGELGVSVIDGEPIVAKLRERASITALVCVLAVLVSWGLAVPIGAVGALRRGKPFDVVTTTVMFVLYAIPTFAVAEILRAEAPAAAASSTRLAMSVAALSASSLATLSRWQRAAMLDVVRQDFVRTARAKGLSAWRVAVVHALRNALMPTVTLAGMHLPALLGGAFVVEEVFGLPGIGFETLRAIEAHDAAWLMAVVLASATVVTLGLVASDVAYGALDPRVRELLVRRQGGVQA